MCVCVGYLRLVFWLSVATREPFGLGLLEKTGGEKGREDREKQKGTAGEKGITENVNDMEEDWNIENRDVIKKEQKEDRWDNEKKIQRRQGHK